MVSLQFSFSAKDEAQVWSLEKAYWEYVKANDLEKYRTLWHENFVGWPLVSLAPVRKDHVTDWITTNKSKAIKLQSYLGSGVMKHAGLIRKLRAGEEE